MEAPDIDVMSWKEVDSSQNYGPLLVEHIAPKTWGYQNWTLILNCPSVNAGVSLASGSVSSQANSSKSAKNLMLHRLRVYSPP